MSIQRKINRGGGPGRTIQIRPFEAEGFTRLEKREGGAHPLWVQETSPGVFTSAWAIHSRDVLAALKACQGKMAMTLVVDTNVPGHPSVSIRLQPVVVVPDRVPE